MRRDPPGLVQVRELTLPIVLVVPEELVRQRPEPKARFRRPVTVLRVSGLRTDLVAPEERAVLVVELVAFLAYALPVPSFRCEILSVGLLRNRATAP